jgi:ABC-type branched-subunit amino acid transport system ATPase component
MNRQESSVAAVRWCEAEGLLDAARKTAGSHTEGLLSFFSLGIAAIVRPPSLVVEDPLPGLSAELADRSVGILEAISAGSRVLVLASDPLRFAGRSRIEAVRGSGGRR